ncbi:HAD family hydrolase [Devosia sp. J2-20]|uniref:HAD family hydrolase n=1 Tax=Devosia sp. J2-20 TaxID=3026161 RepID=UPI00249A6DCC|nr:HAD family hydrolase [Devosia sp. J2-20]WDQ98385.1 HAD family hydrolase [Devosia sp. J2-20]
MSSGLSAPDAELAGRYAPQLMLDRAEPYQPVAFGYTVFRAPEASPSSKFRVEPDGALAIEYAIYYDWDIGHLYDLEHVWVHVGLDGAIAKVEASSHGGRLIMDAGAGQAEMLDGRPVVYVEAGKHAHWAMARQMPVVDRQQLSALCGALAGLEGVHLGNPFAKSGLYQASERDHRLARLKMRHDAFVPSHDYVPVQSRPELMSWSQLADLIPQRIKQIMAGLAASNIHFGAIFLDCGDTLVDERSEVKTAGSDVVLSGDLIPGASDMVQALKAAGHKLVLVADGPRQTFVNLLTQHDLWGLFDAHVISEDVGVLKPDARMFDAALTAAGLTRADAWRCVMVGNNLSRDIKGANALGITSIFMSWSTLRAHTPADRDEVPDYRVTSPAQLPGLIDQLEPLLRFREPTPSSD